MSFGFQVAGTPAAVTAYLKDLRGYGGDNAQLDAVKAFVTAELATLGADRTVFVEASGHRDQHSHHLQLTIKRLEIVSEPAALEAPAEEPGEASARDTAGDAAAPAAAAAE
jgi:hypothetical protein